MLESIGVGVAPPPTTLGPRKAADSCSDGEAGRRRARGAAPYRGRPASRA